MKHTELSCCKNSNETTRWQVHKREASTNSVTVHSSLVASGCWGGSCSHRGLCTILTDRITSARKKVCFEEKKKHSRGTTRGREAWKRKQQNTTPCNCLSDCGSATSWLSATCKNFSFFKLPIFSGRTEKMQRKCKGRLLCCPLSSHRFSHPCFSPLLSSHLSKQCTFMQIFSLLPRSPFCHSITLSLSSPLSALPFAYNSSSCFSVSHNSSGSVTSWFWFTYSLFRSDERGEKSEKERKTSERGKYP